MTNYVKNEAENEKKSLLNSVGAWVVWVCKILAWDKKMACVKTKWSESE